MVKTMNFFEDKQHFNIYYDNNVKSVSYDTFLTSLLKNFKNSNGIMNAILKLFNPLVKWINNGGWFTLCILGAFGIIISVTGMIMSLITLAQESLSTFFVCLSIDLVVLGVAVFGIYNIVKLIKTNKDIFKL